MSAGKSRVTRASREILEIGQEIDKLNGPKLPVVRDVLRLFFHFLRRFKGKREAAWRTAIEVSKIWDTTKIPRQHNNNAVKGIEKLYGEWRGFQKNKNNPRSHAKCEELVQKFRLKLDILHDIGKKNAIQYLEMKTAEARKSGDERECQRWEEETLFYIDQRGPRISTIGGVDVHLEKKEAMARQQELKREQIKQERERRLEERRIKESRKRKAQEETAYDSNLSSLTRTDSSSSQASSRSGPKRGRTDVISPELVETLDAGEISNRKTVKVLAAMTSSMKLPVGDTNLNEKTLRLKRGQLRADAARAVREKFIPDSILTVHWDGKIVPHLTEKRIKQDREAVIVTGQTTAQLLGCFAVKDGTAKQISSAVVRSLREWRLVPHVKAMSFDTTNANSGFTGGAAVLIESELEKEMLWLPCRHHVYERVLADVFHSVMGPSSGPEVSLFKNVASNWRSIDTSKYFYYNYWEESRTALSEDAASIINFAQTQIETGQPREDYLELLELSIIFLGGTPSRGVRFRYPGPVHSARWMAKAIYCLKITLFRKQLLNLKVITEKEAKGILQIAIFVVKAYIHAWFTAPSAIRAPLNDLTFLKELIKYEGVDKSIARAAQNRFSCHLWYLTEVNAGFALFDERLSDDDRKSAVKNIKHCEGAAELERKKLIQMRDVPSLSISSFINKTTMKFFKILGIKTNFLEIPLSQWEDSEEYRQTRNAVNSLRVTNDHAERSVKLMADFNHGLTRNEQSFQDLLVECARP